MTALLRRHWPVLPPVLLAAALGLWSLDFGLPFLFRPDEDVMVGRAVRMAAEGSLDPLFSNYPPLVFYLFALVEKATGQLAPASGADPTPAYLAARSVSATAMAATSGLVFIAARRCYGTGAGVLAGLAMAAAPLATRQAHFATTDAVQTALVAAALLAGVKAESRRGFALAGALCGLAAAAKYTGGMVLVMVLVMAWQRPGRRSLIGIGLAAAAIAFWVPGLVILVHLDSYAGGLGFLGGNAYVRSSGLPLGWVYHPTVTLPYGMGIGAFAMALAGAARAAFARRPADLGLLAYCLVYYLVTGAGHENFFRYMLPLLPALAILAGGVLRAAPGRLAGAALALGLILLLPGLYASISTDRLLGTTDTRVLAARWLEANAESGAAISSPYYGGPFYSRAQIQEQLRNVPDEVAASFLQGRYTDRFAINGPAPAYTLRATASPYQWPLPEPAGAAFVAGAARGPAIYDPLDAFYLPIWGFDQVIRPGPGLVIIRN